MAVNKVDICNMALTLAGGKTINSLEEASTEAVYCRMFFTQTIRSVLAEHPWNCITAWNTPAMIGEAGKNGAPVWPFRYAFHLPPDFLHVARVETGRPEGSLATFSAATVPFRVATHAGNKILLCDIKAPTIRYSREVTDPGVMDAEVVDLIVLLLASKLALPVSESAGRAQSFFQQYKMRLEEAKAADARDGIDVVLYDDTYIRERIGTGEGEPYRSAGWDWLNGGGV